MLTYWDSYWTEMESTGGPLPTDPRAICEGFFNWLAEHDLLDLSCERVRLRRKLAEAKGEPQP